MSVHYRYAALHLALHCIQLFLLVLWALLWQTFYITILRVSFGCSDSQINPYKISALPQSGTKPQLHCSTVMAIRCFYLLPWQPCQQHEQRAASTSGTAVRRISAPCLNLSVQSQGHRCRLIYSSLNWLAYTG